MKIAQEGGAAHRHEDAALSARCSTTVGALGRGDPPPPCNKRFGIHVRATSENGGVATSYGTRVKRGAYAGPALWG